MKTKQTPADKNKPISPFVPLGSILGKVHESVDRWREEENRRLAEVAHLRSVNAELVELVSRAFDRFTDNDMMPPNHALEVWLEKARAALAAADGAAVVVPAVVVAPRLPDRVRDRLRGIIALKLRVPALESEVARLREALAEIADRGPVAGYGSADALRLRLVATQSIARAALAEGGHK